MQDESHNKIIDTIAQIRENAHGLIERELKSRGMTGIMPAHGSIFAFLFRQSTPVPITALVKESGRAKSTVTGMVKTLERHGYLARTASPEDGRSCRVALTEKGWALQKDFDEISEILLHRAYGKMKEEERSTLVQLLTQIEGNLEGN